MAGKAVRTPCWFLWGISVTTNVEVVLPLPEDDVRQTAYSLLISKRLLSDGDCELLSILCWLSPQNTLEGIVVKVGPKGMNRFPDSKLRAGCGGSDWLSKQEGVLICE